MTPNDRARILLLTGPGKGKTTAALGMILRSLAYGRLVLLARFAKNRHSGELDVLGRFPGVCVLSGPCGMTPPADHPDYPAHVAAARGLFARVRRLAGGFDLVVLDEICGLAARGMIAEAEIAAFLAGLGSDRAAVLTGRGAGPGLIAMADTVSDIACVKHAFARGVAAQEGIEL